jgi:ABC-type Fe3+/spermidine/putrescine transport system ATPase subunit
MVTHDQHEAMEVADRIVVMNRGRIEQVGRAVDLYERPASRFVAEFIGRMNLVRGMHGHALAGIRPEHVEIVDGAGNVPDRRVGRIDRCVFLGSITRLTLSFEGQRILVELKGRREDLAPGAQVAVRIPADLLLPLRDGAA